MRRMWVAAVGLMIALSSGGCSLLSDYVTPLGPGPSQAPIEPLGPVVEAGLVEMSGSGFAVTIPRGWTVEVRSPDPDVTAAAPGEAWEALRAYPPDLSAVCSVYVAVVPQAESLAQVVGVGSFEPITSPRWDKRAEGMFLSVPPAGLARDGPMGGSSDVLTRLPGSHPLIPDDVLYDLECAWEGLARPQTPVSCTLLALG